MKNSFMFALATLIASVTLGAVPVAFAASQTDYVRALKRAQYLLSGTLPTDAEFDALTSNDSAYRDAVRKFIEEPAFYDVVLRYHERILGIGLPLTYLQDLQRSDIDGRNLKFARITCSKGSKGAGTAGSQLTCAWNQGDSKRKIGQCPASWQEAVTPFWRPTTTVWVCPSVAQACGSNLSKCFIEYADEDEARNTELGTSEAFDSRFTIIKSLSRQAAGLATAVAVDNYPYTKILAPGLTAVDGAIAHFLSQSHHFDVNKIHVPQGLQEQLTGVKISDTRFKLVYTGDTYETAGVLSTFGFLRRYEKNRTRANQLYERLMCRRFTAELPKVFPQDPGNLRTTPGCSGCHSTLDPLADFFSVWGEGGALYQGLGSAREGSFIGQSGTGLAALAKIIVADEAFSTCTVQNVWEWLMGRKFYKNEEALRTALTQYFIKTNYSFKELVYALATHQAFTTGARTDATVTEPLDQPPVGKVPDITKRECKTGITYTADIAPHIGLCTSCHRTGSGRQSLETEAFWKSLGKTAVGLMASGNMPPGQSGPPASGAVYDLKESVRCWLEQNP